LIPKFIARRTPVLNSQEFYNKNILEFLQTEHLTADSALVESLNNGKRVVYKTVLKENGYAFSKDMIAKIASENPKLLEEYRKIRGASGPLGPEELSADFSPRDFATACKSRLVAIQTGKEAAEEFHSLIFGITIFLFYPWLGCPEKELKIDNGRKRIDIDFANTADDGFFAHCRSAPQTKALKVCFECKNYSSDLKNPEFDQLSGRFGQSGWLGFLVCRKLENRQLAESRCNDAFKNNRGSMIVLEDSHILEMLDLKADGEDFRISEMLSSLHSRILR
jgi:hypothetical protein